jgi:hypothetical protein
VLVVVQDTEIRWAVVLLLTGQLALRPGTGYTDVSTQGQGGWPASTMACSIRWTL